MHPCEVGLNGFLNLELHPWLKLASGIKPPNEFQVQTYENKRAEARSAESRRIREYVPGLVSTQPYGLWTREPGKSHENFSFALH